MFTKEMLEVFLFEGTKVVNNCAISKKRNSTVFIDINELIC